MRSVCQGIIDERRAKPSEKNDLVNAMLYRKDPKTGEMMSDANNMITFLVAGRPLSLRVETDTETYPLQVMKQHPAS